MRWVNDGITEQIIRQAFTEQDVIAELAGALDSFLPGG